MSCQSALVADDELFWCPVTVDGRLDVNVALNRPAVQSSTWSHGQTSYPANNANNGHRGPVLHSLHCAHTDLETNPWWAVDLTVALYVAVVKFYNRDKARTYIRHGLLGVSCDFALRLLYYFKYST